MCKHSNYRKIREEQLNVVYKRSSQGEVDQFSAHFYDAWRIWAVSRACAELHRVKPKYTVNQSSKLISLVEKPVWQDATSSDLQLQTLAFGNLHVIVIEKKNYIRF